MSEKEKLLIFLCSGVEKAPSERLSGRIAIQMQKSGLGERGTLEILSQQRSREPGQRRKMLFLNECRSACVRVLAQSFDKDEYLFIDLCQFVNDATFDIDKFIQVEILPKLNSLDSGRNSP